MRSRCSPVAAVLVTALLGCAGRSDRETTPATTSLETSERGAAQHAPRLQMRGTGSVAHTSGAACMGGTSATSAIASGSATNGPADPIDTREPGEIAAASSAGPSL